MNAIEVKGISKSYGEFKLDKINFVLPEGTIMGLVGGNGAGKSTIMKLIMEAIPADEGTVSVLGVDNRSKEFTRVKEEIGIVLDEANFPEVLNSKQINKIMKRTYMHWNETVYFDYIRKFNLPPDKQFKAYSRGMKMKLSIATALSHGAKLLILDEATGGLDPIVRDEILDILNDFTRDETHTILISSHITSDLEKICDYIAFLHQGKLLMCEEKDVIMNKYRIVKLSAQGFAELPSNAIVRTKKTSFGYESLVLKEEIHPSLQTEKTTLEDIILFMTKEEK